jgi:hypothetical protein
VQAFGEAAGAAECARQLGGVADHLYAVGRAEGLAANEQSRALALDAAEKGDSQAVNGYGPGAGGGQGIGEFEHVGGVDHASRLVLLGASRGRLAQFDDEAWARDGTGEEAAAREASLLLGRRFFGSLQSLSQPLILFLETSGSQAEGAEFALGRLELRLHGLHPGRSAEGVEERHHEQNQGDNAENGDA